MSAAPEPLPVVFLGRPGLEYEAHAPPPALAPWVHAVWRVRAHRGGDLRVLQDGCVDLIDGDVVGPFTAAALFRVEPGYEARGVRLRPGAFPALFGMPASELLDERVPVAELLGRRPASLAALAADAAPPDPLAEAAMRAVGAGALLARERLQPPPPAPPAAGGDRAVPGADGAHRAHAAGAQRRPRRELGAHRRRARLVRRGPHGQRRPRPGRRDAPRAASRRLGTPVG